MTVGKGCGQACRRISEEATGGGDSPQQAPHWSETPPRPPLSVKHDGRELQPFVISSSKQASNDNSEMTPMSRNHFFLAILRKLGDADSCFFSSNQQLLTRDNLKKKTLISRSSFFPSSCVQTENLDVVGGKKQKSAFEKQIFAFFFPQTGQIVAFFLRPSVTAPR